MRFGDTQVNCRKYFVKTKVGSSSASEDGYILNIQGPYKVNPILCMQRDPFHSRKHNQDFSLYRVSLSLGSTNKGDMPDLYGNINLERERERESRLLT